MKYLRPFFVLAILCLFTGTAASQKFDLKYSRTTPEILKAFRPVVAQPSEYTVRVRCDGKDAAFGTIIESNGYILTKASEMFGKITVKTKDGAEHDAKIVGKNEDYDLVMLKVDASGLPIVEWRDSALATVGKWVASPGISENPIAVGVISVAKRKLVFGDQPPKTALNPNTGFLGVGLAPGEGGAKITAVNPGTPAFKAGLKPNDVVYELAGKPILDDEALRDAIQRYKANDTILLKVKRGDEEIELKATLGKIDPKMLGNPQERMGGDLSKRRGQFPFILQHDTVLKPQDCGGPLVDLDGKTVGINIARAGRTESYAIPAEEVQKLLNDLKSGKVTVAKEAPIDPKKDPDLLLRASPALGKKDLASKFRKGSFMKIHEVKLTAGATYVIEMESNEIDSYLIIEDADGTKLAEDDDGAGFPNARLVFRAPTDGTYRVIATTFMPNETGAYTLTVRKEK